MRLHWIDALKGFGIILVVFAHHSLPVALNTYIYSFHMPLFFFISGFLFDFGKYAESASSFVKTRFRYLIVPYFCFAVLTFLFYFLLDKVHPGVTDFGTLYEVICSILFAPGDYDLINPPLWFLPCLFVTELLFYGFVKKCYRETQKLVFWLTAAGMIGYLYSVYVQLRLPWNAEVALTAVVFYGVGNLFRKFTESEVDPGSDVFWDADSSFRKSFSQVEKFLPGVFLLLNLLYLRYLIEFPTAGEINLNGLEYGGFFSYYLLAFSGIFAFVYLFKKIGSSRILGYYGRNSLIVLALHYPIMDILLTFIFFLFGIDLHKANYYNAGISLSLTILNLILLVPVISLINNNLPFLLGKKCPSTNLKGFKLDKLESYRSTGK